MAVGLMPLKEICDSVEWFTETEMMTICQCPIDSLTNKLKMQMIRHFLEWIFFLLYMKMEGNFSFNMYNVEEKLNCSW